MTSVIPRVISPASAVASFSVPLTLRSVSNGVDCAVVVSITVSEAVEDFDDGLGGRCERRNDHGRHRQGSKYTN